MHRYSFTPPIFDPDKSPPIDPTRQSRRCVQGRYQGKAPRNHEQLPRNHEFGYCGKLYQTLCWKAMPFDFLRSRVSMANSMRRQREPENPKRIQLSSPFLSLPLYYNAPFLCKERASPQHKRHGASTIFESGTYVATRILERPTFSQHILNISGCISRSIKSSPMQESYLHCREPDESMLRKKENAANLKCKSSFTRACVSALCATFPAEWIQKFPLTFTLNSREVHVMKGKRTKIILHKATDPSV
ncbi:hypothetical protein MPH_11878 [Macrophomina phaseolina MS6]|uniref:Uncharacterized protein n=1 Tax=Macrophomina phaseolina (strain MS6) TaxID=1126212 RepID=K2QLW3_MACPH|nr:hypothetical protein MPH_11878 [Macrophomina phaseolina MS6]